MTKNVTVHVIDSIQKFKSCTKGILDPPPPLILLDCEGINLSRSGQLCVIQIGVPTKQKDLIIFIIDVILAGKEIVSEHLKELLESQKTLKVIHDAKRDSEALSWQFSVTLDHIFDTQIAHQVLMMEQNKPAREQISFVALVKEFCGIEYREKQQLHQVVEDGMWLKRPFNPDLLQSAVYDIQYMYPAYEEILKRLNKLKEKDNVYEKIYQLSNLWIHAFRKHQIKSSFCRTTFVDIRLPRKHKSINYMLRVIRIPTIEMMKLIVGQKGKSIIQLKNQFSDLFIFNAGQRGPKDFLFLMGDEKRINECTQLLPSFVYEMYINPSECHLLSQKGYGKVIENKTGAVVFMSEDPTQKDRVKLSLIGKNEDSVQQSIELVNARLHI